MKRIIFPLTFLFFSINFLMAQEVQWMTMTEALEAQKKAPKKIFVDAYTTWCGPCKMLDRNTFSNEDVAAFLNEHFYPVKFNAEGNETVKYRDKVFKNPGYQDGRKGRNSVHEFARAMKVSAYPTLVFFDEKGNFIGPIPGYRSPHQLEPILKMFASDDYKKITSNEAYQAYLEDFENEFGM